MAENSYVLEDLYAAWAKELTSNPGKPLAEIREMFEHWGDVTTEPGGIDYIEVDAGGVQAMWAVPKSASEKHVLMCSHGGGYIVGSMYSHRKLFGHFAKAIGCRALILNYRRAPEYPHPGPVNDAMRGYRWLLSSEGIEAHHIAFLGDSAGGGLSISAMLLARDLKLPLPAAAIVLSPYLDMEVLGTTFETNAAFDKLGTRSGVMQFVEVFLGANGNRRDPLANPLCGNLAGLPPILIQAAGYDVLLDDGLRFYEKAKAAGVDVSLEVSPRMQHVYHFMAGTVIEADRAISDAAAWVRPKLGLA